MAAAVDYRGPDGIAYWNSGPVAFAHLQLCTTPESLHERQPLSSPGGEITLVWNGRIDNREDLSALLAAKGARPVDDTDPGLVLAAYLEWGEDCVQHIVGDFALALWDARHRRLWCARDYIGIRAFYYYWDGKTFLFGPDIRALLAHPLVSRKINEGMVGEYLADMITSRDETLYIDIRRLPGGSTLTINSSGSLCIAAWWKPDLSVLRYRTDEQYADRFRELVDQSVRAMMRSNTGFAVEMSGGLDSSTIAVSAQAVMDQNGRSPERVLTFSITTLGKAWDESEDIAAIAQHAGLNSETFEPFRADLEFFRQRAAFWRDLPGAPNGEPMSIPTSAAARRHGVRVLFNGIGGDEWLQASRVHMSDLLAAGQVRQLFGVARYIWGYEGASRHWSIDLTRYLLANIAPDWVKLWKKKRRFAAETILSTQFLRRTHLADRVYPLPDRERRFFSRTQEERYRFVTGGEAARVFEINDREMASAGLELRFPFFERRLAEFLLRLPGGQRQRGSTSKWVLRNAMRERLPRQIQAKAVKAEFRELFDAVMDVPEGRERVKNLAIFRHTDWLRGGSTERMEFWLPGRRDALSLFFVWMVIGMDLWLEEMLANGEQAPDRCSKMEQRLFPA